MSLTIESVGSQIQQDSYRQSIEVVIQDIRRTRTGRIVLNLIEISTRTVTIVPSADGGGIHAEAIPEFEGSSGTFSPHRLARGTNARVRFSVGLDIPNIPQGRSDEVLLHELAHALRMISGAERYSRDARGNRILLPIASFENVEEFFAAIVGSVHSSELGRQVLGNHGYWALTDYSVLQRPPYSTRLREIWGHMPRFAEDMGMIPAEVAAFNPFRDVSH